MIDGPPINLESANTLEEVFLLGSALPDIASMGRVRLQRPLVNSTLDLGVQNHHYADSAFHQSAWFVQRNAALHDKLEGAGLKRGPARACAHVGIELLLDGALLATIPHLSVAVQGCLQRAGDQSLDLQASVKPDRADHWQTHLDRTAKWLLPNDYHRPSAVAHRLHRIVANRPRLAFPSDQIISVEDVLARSQEELISGLADLVEDLAEEVARHQAQPRNSKPG